jgi:hypothetical protein
MIPSYHHLAAVKPRALSLDATPTALVEPGRTRAACDVNALS